MVPSIEVENQYSFLMGRVAIDSGWHRSQPDQKAELAAQTNFNFTTETVCQLDAKSTDCRKINSFVFWSFGILIRKLSGKTSVGILQEINNGICVG